MKTDYDPKISPDVQYGNDENWADSKVFTDFLGKLRPQVFSDVMDRGDWENEMGRLYNTRYGIPEETITYPWPNAASVMMPAEDMLIDRIKPGMIGLISNQSPTVSFEALLGAKPENKDRAKNCEYTMDNLLKVRDPNYIQESARCIDNVLAYGWGIEHPFYLYRTELSRLCIHRDRLPSPLNGFMVLGRGTSMQQAELLYRASQGKVRPITRQMFDQLSDKVRELVKQAWHLFDENVTDKEAIDEIMVWLRSGEGKILDVVVRQETANTSTACSIEPFDIWVPATTRGIQSARRITTRLNLSEEEVTRRMRDEAWDKKAVEEVLQPRRDMRSATTMYGGSQNSPDFNSWAMNRNIDVIRSEREGISNISSITGNYEFFATYCWANFFSKKEKSRGIVVWSPYCERPIKVRPLPNNHGQWPFVQIRYEMNDDRFYSSRGIPAKIKDLSLEWTWQERSVLNNAQIVNSPTFMYEEGSNFDPGDIPWAPAQWLKVGRVDRVMPLAAPDRQLNFERHSQILRSIIEQYAGAPDLALNSLNGQGQDARTAREIDLISQMSQVTLGYHSQIVQWCKTQSYKQIWSNWIQWGPDEFMVRISGEEPVRLTKQDIIGDFELIPKGTAGNVNPALEAKKSLERLSVAAQLKPILDQDPQARYDLDLPEMFRDYLQKEDFVMAKRVFKVRTPEERKQVLAERQKQQEMMSGVQNGQRPMPLQAFQKRLDTAEKNAPMGPLQPVSS